jgi:hypothetical protein
VARHGLAHQMARQLVPFIHAGDTLPHDLGAGGRPGHAR